MPNPRLEASPLHAQGPGTLMPMAVVVEFSREVALDRGLNDHVAKRWMPARCRRAGRTGYDAETGGSACQERKTRG